MQETKLLYLIDSTILRKRTIWTRRLETQQSQKQVSAMSVQQAPFKRRKRFPEHFESSLPASVHTDDNFTTARGPLMCTCDAGTCLHI